MGTPSFGRRRTALLLAVLGLGCANTANGNVADATADTDTLDVTSDVTVDSFVDRAAPDVTADVTVTDASEDVSGDAAAVDVEVTPGRVTVRADSICGVSVGMDGSASWVLYAARVGGRSEVRVERFDRGLEGASSLVLARYDNASACVGRRSLIRDARGGYRAAWWNGSDAVELAAFDASGAITARATTRTDGAAPAQLVDNAIALDDLWGESLAWVDRTASGARLHAAVLDHVTGTAESPVTVRLLSAASVALPDGVTSAALSTDRVGFTLSGRDGEAYLRSYATADGGVTMGSPLTVSGLGAEPQIHSLTSLSGLSLLPAASFSGGLRNLTVLYITGADLAGPAAAARAFASDTAWNRTDALPIYISQSPGKGAGMVWATHDGGGYNRTVRYGLLGADPSSSCVVTRSSDEQSEWRSFAFEQIGARDKVLAMVRRIATGATSREELVVFLRGDGQGICDL